MDDGSLQQLRKKKRLMWFGLFFFGIIAILGLGSGDWLMLLGGGVMTIGAIAALVIMNRQLKALAPYRPGKGFWYYRLTRRQKMNYVTASEIFIILLIAFFFWAGVLTWYVLFASIGSLLYLQFVIKRRIKHHTPVDDATLFELEELGIIQPEDIVKGLYKDFESWSTVGESAKILVLTPYRLIVIVMSSPEQGDRMEIRLRDINRLYLMGNGRQGQGLIATVGLTDGSILRFTLHGNSHQDSPEQFVQQLLESIDNLYIKQPGMPDPAAAAPRIRPLEAPAVGSIPRPTFRLIDLHEATANPDAEQTPAIEAGQRVLDL
jgi:hypothetical protein